MRWIVLWIAALMTWPASAEDIDAVLARSQQMRLQAMPAGAAGASERLQRDFDGLRQILGPAVSGARLQVVSAGTIAETFEGRVVVVHEAIAEWDEAERLFVLAHELGHVARGHWGQLARIYRRHIPGEVTPATTGGAVGALLGREAAGASQQHELEADALALEAVHRYGYRVDDVIPVFMRIGAIGDTATHPGSRRRVAQLRLLDAEAVRPSLAAGY